MKSLEKNMWTVLFVFVLAAITLLVFQMGNQGVQVLWAFLIGIVFGFALSGE